MSSVGSGEGEQGTGGRRSASCENQPVTSTSSDEEQYQNTLRPRRLIEFVGQDREKKRLAIAIQAAKQRGEPLEHLLLEGLPGFGKETLAVLVANEMDSRFICTSGPSIENIGDLMGILTNLEQGDLLFVDEIHRTRRVIAEPLGLAMKDFAADFVLDKGAFAKAIRLTLKRFTLVGSTPRQGLLSSPMRDRFGLSFHLDFYSVDDLSMIVERASRLLNVEIDADSSLEIGRRSRGTPRIANRLLRRVRDFAQVHRARSIDVALVDAALELEGVDHLGLNDLDRRYLQTLIEQYEGGPVGVAALAATMQHAEERLENQVEPFLLHQGFIIRTAAGRRATFRAYEYLKVGC